MLAACSQWRLGGHQPASAASKKPIVIGTSLSLTGDFSADGQAFLRGYELWVTTSTPRAACSAARSSSSILNDRSDPGQVVTNYTDPDHLPTMWT